MSMIWATVFGFICGAIGGYLLGQVSAYGDAYHKAGKEFARLHPDLTKELLKLEKSKETSGS